MADLKRESDGSDSDVPLRLKSKRPCLFEPSLVEVKSFPEERSETEHDMKGNDNLEKPSYEQRLDNDRARRLDSQRFWSVLLEPKVFSKLIKDNMQKLLFKATPWSYIIQQSYLNPRKSPANASRLLLAGVEQGAIDEALLIDVAREFDSAEDGLNNEENEPLHPVRQVFLARALDALHGDVSFPLLGIFATMKFSAFEEALPQLTDDAGAVILDWLYEIDEIAYKIAQTEAAKASVGEVAKYYCAVQDTCDRMVQLQFHTCFARTVQYLKSRHGGPMNWNLELVAKNDREHVMALRGSLRPASDMMKLLA